MKQKIALFIDGANVYATVKALGYDLDYKKVRNYFEGENFMLRAFYYTALSPANQEADGFNSMRPLLDWLDYNGFKVITKEAKEFTLADGRRKVKGNMSVELTVDALDLAPSIDQAIILSGDGDFTELVKGLQRRGVHVTVVSEITTQPPMVADELRRQADTFVNFSKIQSLVERDPNDKPDRRERGEQKESLPSFVTGTQETVTG